MAEWGGGCGVSCFQFLLGMEGMNGGVWVWKGVNGVRHLLIRLMRRLDQALADPNTLSQSTIVENLDPLESARLRKVRNIGIAVCKSILHFWFDRVELAN